MALSKQQAPVETAQAEDPTMSQKFLAKVERQVKAELGSSLEWTPVQKALAQHLFLKIDRQLAALEAKRAGNSYKKNDPPITWVNVNQAKLAIDAVHVVNLGLDANVANHVHVIPYLNNRTKQYDVDLMIGYAGKDHVARTMAIDQIVDIRYQLVYEGDEFDIVKNADGSESPVYKPANYFKPGEVVGFFGHVICQDPRKTRVVVVPYREFEKAMNASKGVEFWGGEQTEWKDGKKVAAGYDEKFRIEMMFKTGVIRTTKTIALDPAKINAPSLTYMQRVEMARAEDVIDAEAEEFANAKVIEIAPAIAPDAGLKEAPAADKETGVVEEPAQATLSAEEDPGY